MMRGIVFSLIGGLLFVSNGGLAARKGRSSVRERTMTAKPSTQTQENFQSQNLSFMENHPAFVGAAEYAQISRTRVAPRLAIGDRSATHKMNITAGSGDAVVSAKSLAQLITSQQSLEMIGLHKLPNSNLRVGLKYARDVESGKAKIDIGDQEFTATFKSEVTDLGPLFALPVSANLAVGAEFLSGSYTWDYENDAAQSTAYTSFSPSLIYQNESGGQLGLRYEPTIAIRETSVSFSRTGGVFLEGRIREAKDSARTWFGGVSYLHHRNIDSDRLNNFEFNGGMDFDMGSGSTVSAYATYKMASHTDGESFNPDTAAQTGIGFGGGWIITEGGRVGADVTVRSRDSRLEGEVVADQHLTGSVTGAFFF